MRGDWDAATGTAGDWEAGAFPLATGPDHRPEPRAGEAGAFDRLAVFGRAVRRGLHGRPRSAAAGYPSDGGIGDFKTHAQSLGRGSLRALGGEPLLPIFLRRGILPAPIGFRSLVLDALAPAHGARRSLKRCCRKAFLLRTRRARFRPKTSSAWPWIPPCSPRRSPIPPTPGSCTARSRNWSAWPRAKALSCAKAISGSPSALRSWSDAIAMRLS